MPVDHKTIPITLLDPHKRNYRNHPEEQVSYLVESLRAFDGQIRSIVVRPSKDGRYTILAGHGITEAAKRSGLSEMYCDIVPEDWSDIQCIAYLKADNMDGAEDDMVKVAQILEEVRASGEIELAALGSSSEKVDALLEELANQALQDAKPGLGGDDFEIPEELEPKSKFGDVWALGKHRLLVGDSTNVEQVKFLLDGKKINVAVTSPPYAQQREYDPESGFKPIPPDKYIEWFASVQQGIAENLAKDGSYFLNIKEHCDDGQRHLYVKDLTIAHVRQWGWRFVDEFCWKRNSVPGGWNNRFKNGWEPVFHFCRQASIKFNPENVSHPSKDVFVYSPDNAKSKTGFHSNKGRSEFIHEGLARPANVLELGAETGQTEHHAAPYPVGLPEFFIKAFSDENDIIFDPFLGSGTTMIAAERTNRVCYGMELSPKYADVIIKRWEAETGQGAQLLSSIELAGVTNG